MSAMQNTVDCPCGGSKWDHRRVIEATQKAARLEQEVMQLKYLIATFGIDPSTMPLYRRIANQRRALKWANHYQELYWRLLAKTRQEPERQAAGGK